MKMTNVHFFFQASKKATKMELAYYYQKQQQKQQSLIEWYQKSSRVIIARFNGHGLDLSFTLVLRVLLKVEKRDINIVQKW